MNAHEQAQRELAAAQAKVSMLARIPTTDPYPDGTVIRWRTGVQWFVAVKGREKVGRTPGWVTESAWYVAGRDRAISWGTLVSSYLTRDVARFEAATSWNDGFVATQPPVVMSHENGGLVLTDTLRDITWVLQGEEWVKEDNLT